MLIGVDLLGAGDPGQHETLGCPRMTQRGGHHLTSLPKPQVISWQEQSQLKHTTEYRLLYTFQCLCVLLPLGEQNDEVFTSNIY